MKKFFTCCAIALALAVLVSFKVWAQNADDAYKKVAFDRASKIVATLKIGSKVKSSRVTEVIAGQYIGLNQLQAARDAQIKAASGDTAKVSAIKQKADKATADLHASFLKKLSAQLSASQIEGVKNGITYNTVPITYANYLLMLPYLKADQQKQIMTYLLEAREKALDGGTAKEKQAWFGKYKGRIANYLSGLGYNLKKEGDDWAVRRDTLSTKVEIVRSNTVMKELALDTADKARNESVRNLVALQYQKISEYNAERDLKLKQLKDSTSMSKEAAAKAEQDTWTVMKGKLDEQRAAFLEKLPAFLNAEQIEQLKNSMTFNGFKKEYDKFLALLPDMKADQKKKVYDYLIEARENAMNVRTSRETNQWFAKYRGRANNYLAAQGYNLRKATEDLERKTGKPQ